MTVHKYILIVSVLRVTTIVRGQQEARQLGQQFSFDVSGTNPFLPVNSLRDRLRDRISNTLGGVLVSNVKVPVGSVCLTPALTPGDCRSLEHCVRFFLEIEQLRRAPCLLPSGGTGVCCPHSLLIHSLPSSGQGSLFSNILPLPEFPEVEIPNIRTADIYTASLAAIANIRRRNEFENSLFRSGIVTGRGTSAFGNQRFHATNRIASREGAKALLAQEASLQLMASFKLNPDQGTFALPRFTLKGSPIENTCPELPVDCPESPYRTIDGSCNNLEKPHMGMANIPLQRLLPPKYEDGVMLPRSKNLPSPREISTAVTSSQDKPDSKYTLLLMQWGQFTDHDITHTPVVKNQQESGIKCCNETTGAKVPRSVRHRECFSIDVPEDDPLYGRYNSRCMEFVRSMPAPRLQCNFGPREQVNQITGWLDGSNVYGSEMPEARKLRLLDGGRLRVTMVQGRALLPLDPSQCSNDALHRYCFSAGDLRCNEQLDLTVLHTIWMREHNRIADALSVINPEWDDERLYQEARRIVIAEMQHITFKEWLPIILGQNYLDKFNMTMLNSGFSSSYNADVNASITNVFATAAFRFGHSMIQGSLESFNLFGSRMRTLTITQTQFRPYQLYDNNTIETFVRGLTTQPSQRMDSSFSRELTGHLFQEEGESFGMDLFSLNIQRGRDHGLAPYMEWRRLCELPTYSTWKELSSIFPSNVVARLQSLYSRVEDIDLFPGGVLESPEEGILGPTFQCLVGDQFHRLKKGDRFFYEHSMNGLTPTQLSQIRRTSIARVICDNAENIGSIQRQPFRIPDSQNSREQCNSDAIPRLDLTKWRAQV